MANITVIEIDSEIIKIVQAKNSSKELAVNKVLAYSVKGLTAEACASTINQLINKSGIKIDKLIGVMSRKDLATRILKLPSANNAELQQMVSLEALKQIPFPPEDIIFDYRVMETDAEGYSYVILSIAHKNVINKTIDIFNKSKLRPDILTLTTEGLYLWANFVLGESLRNISSTLIMNIDRNNIEIEIVSEGKILLSRVSSFGALSLAEGAPDYQKYRERLLLETKRTVEVYNKEQNQSRQVEKMIITGPQNIAASINSIFKNEFNINTSVFSSTTAFSIEEGAFLQEGLPEGTSISSTLGAVFTLDRPSLNMLPPEAKRKQEIAQKSKKVIILGALSLCLVFMMSAAIILKGYQNKMLLNNLKSSVKKIKPFTKELESKFEKLKMMQAHIESTKRSLVFLYELNNIIPQNVLLNYLSFSKDGKIALQGTTPAMSAVFEFVNILEKSKRFQNVETAYVSKRRLKEKETVDFQITCELSPER